jgi:signal transduction histidine kinase
MKLITKTSRYYILFALPLLLIAAFFSYLFMLHEIGESNETLLFSRLKVVEKQLKKGDSSILSVFQENRELFIKEIAVDHQIEAQFSDTLIFSEMKAEYISYKTLRKSVQIDSKNYLIQVWKSSIEIHEIVEVIFFVFLSILVLLLLTVIYINIRISKRLLNPFFETVKSIKKFRVSDGERLAFQETTIDEFQELNKAIYLMTDKMILDFSNQKKFTENASHEFQTPLAIIKTKIDLLLQSNNLTENEMKLLSSIDDATSRLSKINRSLLLLSKIENGQFQNNTNVFLKVLVDNILEQHEDYLLSKKIEIENTLPPDFTFLLNEDLAIILLTNLVQNAIRHNIIGGKISIYEENNIFCIANSGNSTPLDEKLIFERFEKKSPDSHSIGLGLAIVKEIADFNTLAINYFYKEGFHRFTLVQKK